MRIVEQDVIESMDSHYAAIDRAAFASKNLYNAALHQIRQSFSGISTLSGDRRHRGLEYLVL